MPINSWITYIFTNCYLLNVKQILLLWYILKKKKIITIHKYSKTSFTQASLCTWYQTVHDIVRFFCAPNRLSDCMLLMKLRIFEIDSSLSVIILYCKALCAFCLRLEKRFIIYALHYYYYYHCSIWLSAWWWRSTDYCVLRRTCT